MAWDAHRGVELVTASRTLIGIESQLSNFAIYNALNGGAERVHRSQIAHAVCYVQARMAIRVPNPVPDPTAPGDSKAVAWVIAIVVLSVGLLLGFAL